MCSNTDESETLRAVLTELIPRLSSKPTIVLIRDQFGVRLATTLLFEDDSFRMPQAEFPNVALFVPEIGWYFAIDVVELAGRFSAARTGVLARMFARHRTVLLNVYAREEDFDRRVPVPWFTSAWTADKPTRLIHFGGARNWRGTSSWDRPLLQMQRHPMCGKFGQPHIRLGHRNNQPGIEMAAEVAYEVEI